LFFKFKKRAKVINIKQGTGKKSGCLDAKSVSGKKQKTKNKNKTRRAKVVKQNKGKEREKREGSSWEYLSPSHT
jgi:hypothetical protein